MKETVIPKTRTVNLLNVVLSKIKYEPEVLVKVVNILESEPSFQKQANELVRSYRSKLSMLRAMCSQVLLFVNMYAPFSTGVS